MIMDTDEYERKVTTILSDDKTGEKLKKHPTRKYKRQLVSIIRKVKEDNKITEKQYKFLYPTAENLARMFCTPKIHKPDNPLRPIVDDTGSIGYNVSREDIFTLETITVDSGGLDTFAAWKEIITSLGMHTNKTSKDCGRCRVTRSGLILGSRY